MLSIVVVLSRHISITMLLIFRISKAKVTVSKLNFDHFVGLRKITQTRHFNRKVSGFFEIPKSGIFADFGNASDFAVDF